MFSDRVHTEKGDCAKVQGPLAHHCLLLEGHTLHKETRTLTLMVWVRSPMHPFRVHGVHGLVPDRGTPIYRVPDTIAAYAAVVLTESRSAVSLADSCSAAINASCLCLREPRLTLDL